MGKEVSIRGASGRRFVLDSGVFDAEGKLPAELRALAKDRLFTTYASLVECVRDRTRGARTRDANIRRSVAEVLSPSASIALRAYRLFEGLRPLSDDGPGLADLYIAAAALEHNLVVITRDRRDFLVVPEVEFVAAWAA